MDAEEWNRRYAGAELVWSAGPNRFLPPEVDGLPRGRALDLACGEGRNAIWLAEQGWATTAVDFSDVAVEKAERLAAARGVSVDWVVADVTRWTTPHPRSFDLVIIFYLQLPAAERRATVATAGAALAPGGTLVFVAHDLENLTKGVGGPQDASVLPTPEAVVADLAAVGPPGLEVERAERVVRPVATDAGEASAIDCLVRARVAST